MREHAGAVADVEFVGLQNLQVARKMLLIPSRVALRAEEDGALVVADAVHGVALRGEVNADFRANEAPRSR